MKKLFSERERPLAWAQLSHQKVRTGVAMGGIAFANVLIFMQLGFVNLFAGGAILLPKHLKGDLFITNSEAEMINPFSTFDLTRLYQAAAFDEIISAEPLYLKYGTWAYDKETISYQTQVFAYNPQSQIFDLPELNQQQAKLREPFTVLFDRLSRSELGPIPAQMQTKSTTSAMLNNQRLVVNGLFSLGCSFFLSEGNIITSDRTFAEMYGSNSLNQISFASNRAPISAPSNKASNKLSLASKPSPIKNCKREN
jgi:putative ABC transport system permease protein